MMLWEYVLVLLLVLCPRAAGFKGKPQSSEPRTFRPFQNVLLFFAEKMKLAFLNRSELLERSADCLCTHQSKAYYDCLSTWLLDTVTVWLVDTQRLF